jgi:O-antigen ligase
MIRSIGGQIGLVLTALFLGGTLVLPFNGGYVLAYALIALTLLLTLSLLIARGKWIVGPAGWCFLIAFALILVAHIIDGDALVAVNFAFLVAFVPLQSWLARHAAPDSAAVVSWLAFTGTLVSGITAVREVMLLGADRAEGWWSDPIWAAQAALVLGVLCLVGFPVMRTRWRYLLLLGPVIGFAVVWMSGSRGPLIAAPAILLALAFTTFRPWWKQFAAVGAVAVVAAVAVFTLAPQAVGRYTRIVPVIVELFTTGDIEEHSAGYRIVYWKAGTAAFLDRPWTGYGWSNYLRAAYDKMPDKGKRFLPKKGYRGNHHLHADILDMGVAGGLMGLAAYALMLLAPLLGAFRSVRDSQYVARITGAIVLSVGYFACGLTYLMFGYEFHTTLYVCLAAVIIGFCRDVPTSPISFPAKAGTQSPTGST